MTLGPVRVMGAGVVVIPRAVEVTRSIDFILPFSITSNNCLIVSCSSLTDPNNGVISCSLGDDGVPSYEDYCKFKCNTGYELTGRVDFY